ncbi:oxepin-CoA hydrolase, alternative type [Piscinibacter sp.]|jgi:enoyl-CoA hydratase/carnithine racemase|uniref:oxepin-CoA hydrolase, alternative type n=1 Tax=Piscinibacter sp. TaxID=1903157 RepID=UPI00355A0EBB
MSSELKTERHGSTLVLTLSDPATRNTLSEQLICAGIEALNVAEADTDTRAVVLRGDGTHFCAGGNLHGLNARRQSGPPAQAQMLDRLHQFIEALRVFPKPVIAAVEGAAAGAGFSLALACDLIVAAEDARFILSYARVGLTPDGGATWHLARALPRQLVQQWVWLAEPASARQLHGLGLVNWVTGSGHALAEALTVADRLAEMAPNAVSSAKELLHLAASQGLTQQLQSERDHFIENLFHANAGEGLQAFFERRPPRFR